MDSYRSSNQQDQEDSLGAIPVSLGSYHNPPPPPPNPIRVSAFSKLSSATSSLNILSPKDHHHHHHRGTVVARNNGGSSVTTTTNQFMMTAPSTTAADHQHPIPVSISPSSAAAAAAATPNSTAAAVKYRECLRNHAASVGGHVLDGCCEFMPSDADPLKCAACDCHRSFHTVGTTSRRDRISLPPQLLLPPPPPPHPTSALHISHLSQYSHKQQQHSVAFPPSPSGVVPGSSPMVAFGGNNSGSGATTESSSEERLDAMTPQQQQNMVVSKKRFRTRFTPEQKEKMLSFAESVGWRIQRQDDGMVENFCREIGVRRQVLRVWMHNNKHSIIRKQQQQQQPPQQPADSALTPTSQPPAPPIFGHVRN